MEASEFFFIVWDTTLALQELPEVPTLLIRHPAPYAPRFFFGKRPVQAGPHDLARSADSSAPLFTHLALFFGLFT